jgi:hypothetical protein
LPILRLCMISPRIPTSRTKEYADFSTSADRANA